MRIGWPNMTTSLEDDFDIGDEASATHIVIWYLDDGREDNGAWRERPKRKTSARAYLAAHALKIMTSTLIDLIRWAFRFDGERPIVLMTSTSMEKTPGRISAYFSEQYKS